MWVIHKVGASPYLFHTPISMAQILIAPPPPCSLIKKRERITEAHIGQGLIAEGLEGGVGLVEGGRRCSEAGADFFVNVLYIRFQKLLFPQDKVVLRNPTPLLLTFVHRVPIALAALYAILLLCGAGIAPAPLAASPTRVVHRPTLVRLQHVTGHGSLLERFGGGIGLKLKNRRFRDREASLFFRQHALLRRADRRVAHAAED